ncbi:hypothetical protein [Pseudomonas koreensis]|uniref:Uncharacterized protein n=1 Tax=Pseudomonas koreensis TaxID=198620 RepID=A0A9X2XDI1_9PSED|nr:hypothetical protein [Pseudomonas koreensis]MCU7246623.1 hypothetical protein [Pseudomonas koreensis]
MSTITGDPTHGFSEQAIDYLAPRPRAIPYAPLAGCRTGSGVIDHFESIWPWGSVLATEVLNGAPIFRDSVFFEVIVNFLDHQIGDEIRVQGQAVEGGGVVSCCRLKRLPISPLTCDFPFQMLKP